MGQESLGEQEGGVGASCEMQSITSKGQLEESRWVPLLGRYRDSCWNTYVAGQQMRWAGGSKGNLKIAAHPQSVPLN